MSEIVKGFEYRECDRALYERELKDFLPDKIFDVHVHMYVPCRRKRQLFQRSSQGLLRGRNWSGSYA